MVEAAELFRHCPACGASGLGCRGERRFACPACGQVFFHNTATGVGVLIGDGRGSVLLVRRKHEPGAGLLDLPGGFVDHREGAEDAVHREVREEVGLEVIDLRYLCSAPNHYEYRGLHYHVCDIFYTGRAVDLAAAVAADDAAACEIVPVPALDPAGFAFASTRLAVARYRAAANPPPL